MYNVLLLNVNSLLFVKCLECLCLYLTTICTLDYYTSLLQKQERLLQLTICSDFRNKYFLVFQ